jgi:hypothetical protein
MPDICDLVLDDHERFRRLFAELDEHKARGGGGTFELASAWATLAGMLERHAGAEEELLYPRLLRKGTDADAETDDAIHDHNDIRLGIARAAQAEVGSEDWWGAVLDTRRDNSDHIAEEERGALPDFRAHVDPATRSELGARWLRYSREHAGGMGLSLHQEDVDEYKREHR